MLMLTFLMTAPSCFSLWPLPQCLCLGGQSCCISILQIISKCRLQHREREWNYESENASAALFSPAMLFYSPLLLVLLRGVACRCQASCGKTVKREISKEELEKSCLILRIHVSSQFSELRPSSHPPPCKCCSSQWVAQAGLVYNPLIITKCIEDFDERGKSRHWIPIMWCMLGAGTLKHHQYVQCILSLHPFSCR